MTTGDHPEGPHRTPPAAGPQPHINAYGYGTAREQAAQAASRPAGNRRGVVIVAAVAVIALLAGIGTAIAINAFTSDDHPTGSLPDAPVATLPTTSEPSPTSSQQPPTQAPDPTGEPTQSTEPELIAGPDLDVGACIADPYESAEQNPDGSYLVEGYTVVPCNESHYGEVFMQTASRASTYDVDGIIVESEQLCYTGYASYVGRSYQESELFMEPFVPTADAWAEGVRDVTCVVVDPSGPLTTSVRGSGR